MALLKRKLFGRSKELQPASFCEQSTSETPFQHSGSKHQTTSINIIDLDLTEATRRDRSRYMKTNDTNGSKYSVNVYSPSGTLVTSKCVNHTKTITSPLLEILSPDLHHYLAIHYLDFDTLIALRQSCHHFYRLLNTKLLKRLRVEIIKQYLREEAAQLQTYRENNPPVNPYLWNVFYSAFEELQERPAKDLRCYGCLVIKPLHCFVSRMSSRGTGLGGKMAKDRMCKDCMRCYRRIGGVWWREHMVKTADMARKTRTIERWRRWALEGTSLLAPEEEIGVCCRCGTGSYDLYWGCAGCFEAEQHRIREEDLEDFDGKAKRIVGSFYDWKVRREISTRRKYVKAFRVRWLDFLMRSKWEGTLEDRMEALFEWFHNEPRLEGNIAEDQNEGTTLEAKAEKGTLSFENSWSAISQVCVPKDRREVRCSSCWVPFSRKMYYMLGLSYERHLPRERWCKDCKEEDDVKTLTKKTRLERSRMDKLKELEDMGTRDQDPTTTSFTKSGGVVLEGLEGIQGLFEIDEG